MSFFHPRLAPLATLCLVLLLGACEGTRPIATMGRPGAPGTQPNAIPEGRPPAGGDDDLSRLRGLTAGDLTAKLGDPSYRRRENPAEIWQYFGPGCVLDLFLYEDKGAQRVTHAELRSRNLTPAAQAACLSRLLEGKRDDTDS
ncbi:MAG TPA: hypothetical protein VN809_14655 [Telmatospirillum sp.]|nr:hypothetical protein [Telmatospirillum sp.]